MNLHISILAVISFTLLNCNVVNTLIETEKNDNFQSPEEFLWKSLVPFYMEEVFLRISSLDNYEEIIFAQVSEPCKVDSSEWISHLVNTTEPNLAEPWALTLIDAWGKPPSGILNIERNKAALGDYDACVGVRAENADTNIGFRGKYCLSVIPTRPQSRTSLSSVNATFAEKNVAGSDAVSLFGSCVPSTCSEEDVRAFAENIINLLHFELNEGIEVLDCFTSEVSRLNTGEVIMLLVLATLVIVSMMAAIFESTARKTLNVREGNLREIFTSFSFTKNLTTLLTGEDKKELACLGGIRLLTVAWIILSHTWDTPYVGSASAWKAFPPEKTDPTSWSILLIRNGGLAMDTLFTVSGLAISYSLLQELDKFDGKVNVIVFYLRRLLRLTPVYAVVVGFMATLYPHFGDGPFSGFILHSAQNCEDNWWKNLLYVNNFANVTYENMCLGDSWYFANEMQFLLLTPLLVFVLWKYGRVGIGILTIVIIGSILAPGILTFDGDMLPTVIPTRDFFEYFEELHVKPWVRASPYLVGILSGYFIHRFRKNLKISKAVVLAGWLISTAAALSIIFGIFPYLDPVTEIPVAEASIYAAAHRFGWGVVISWIIFACSKGYGGWINSFLSLKVLHPLSRLSVTAFLVALPVQMTLHFRFRDILITDTYIKVNLFLADLVMTLFVASLLTLFVELPCLQMEMAYNRRRKDELERDLNMEVRPPSERYGIYYNKDVSLCIEESKGRRRKIKETELQPQPRPERYGIYYEKNISISIEPARKNAH